MIGLQLLNPPKQRTSNAEDAPPKKKRICWFLVGPSKFENFFGVEGSRTNRSQTLLALHGHLHKELASWAVQR